MEGRGEVANLQLNLHPLKLNSAEENIVSCFQDKAWLYVFPHENMRLVID